MPTEPTEDTRRALAAAKTIIDGRDLSADRGAIMVTLEHLVSTVLLAVMDRNPRMAVGMLNEGLVPGVEGRIAILEAKRAI